jgi:hypothetical protein
MPGMQVRLVNDLEAGGREGLCQLPRMVASTDISPASMTFASAVLSFAARLPR